MTTAYGWDAAGNPTLVDTKPAAVVPVTAAVSGVTTVETQICKFTIPAGTLTVGSTYRVTMAGLASNSTTAGTIVARVRIGATGATTEAEPAQVTVGTRTTAATNVPFYAELLVTFRTVGAVGTAIGSGQISSPNLTFTSTVAGTTAPAVVDTTVSRIIQGTLVCTGAGVSLTVHAAAIERVA